MRHPLIPENQKDEDDIIHRYNPNKQPTPAGYSKSTKSNES